MRIAEFLHGVKIVDTNISPDTEFADLTHDSRMANVRTPFICLTGEREDGHEFIWQAQKKGAAVLCSRLPCNYHGKYILCRDMRASDAVIHANLHHNPQRKLKVIGVTGTNGKTSVCHMLHSILKASGVKCAMSGTVGNYIGGEMHEASMTTPMPCELYGLMETAVLSGDEYFITEVSSHSLEYDKFAPTVFTLSVFTNLTPEHLDFHKTMENYMSSKGKLFEKSVISLINADDEHYRYMYDKSSCLKYCYSVKNETSDYLAVNQRDIGSGGVEYDMLGDSEIIHISSEIPGGFTVSNTLAAAAGARLLGMECRDISFALRTMKGVPGRMERVSSGCDFDVFIDYAHTPDALENILATARDFARADQNIWILFGCGGDRDKSKRPVMGQIAKRLADRVIITSDNSRSEEPFDIIDDILKGIDNREGVTVIENRKEALMWAVENLPTGDILIVAGKGHENYEIDKKGKHSFNEKEILRKAIEQKSANNDIR